MRQDIVNTRTGRAKCVGLHDFRLETKTNGPLIQMTVHSAAGRLLATGEWRVAEKQMRLDRFSPYGDCHGHADSPIETLADAMAAVYAEAQCSPYLTVDDIEKRPRPHNGEFNARWDEFDVQPVWAADGDAPIRCRYDAGNDWFMPLERGPAIWGTDAKAWTPVKQTAAA